MAEIARIDQLNLSHVMKVMILVCKPGLTGKLSEVWEGLYQIEQKLSDVNYKFQISDKAKGKLAHINLFKQRHTAYKIHRIIAAAEDADCEEIST